MSEAPTPTPPNVPTRRQRRRAWRAYAQTWLLSCFLALGVSLTDFANRVATGERERGAFVGAVLYCVVLALLSLPALWLLRIFREPSSSSGVRFVRRLLLGCWCGLVPAGLLAGFVAAGGNGSRELGSQLGFMGACFGLAAGIIDSIHLDAGEHELSA